MIPSRKLGLTVKDEYDLYKKRTQETDKIFSPSFCLAKWYHANIYFQTGETHSCYHPAPHKINQSQILKTPSCLHNTHEKKKERKQMLAGERPSGCQYCWNIEDLGKELISDRQIRTGSLFKPNRIDEIKNNSPDFNVLPEYIELSFSNLCNFKCGYCHPKASSRYHNEIKEFGPYSDVQNHRCDIDWFKIYDEEKNPYLDAWWKWWPELKKTLRILRITGGEPLLQKSTYRTLDVMSEMPIPELELNINSNLGSRKEIIEKFCTQVEALTQQKKIRTFKLFSSVDTWGPQAEYIRTGLDLQLFENNLKTYLRTTSSPLTLMITFNIFSIPSFSKLLEKILEWRQEFQFADKDYFHRIRFDISYLKEPLQYDINILPKEDFLPYMEKHLEFMKNNMDDSRKDKFSFMEYQRLLRVYEYMKNTHYPEDKVQEGRRDFYRFFKEQDRRRQTNLLQNFPQLEAFWEQCSKASTEYRNLESTPAHITKLSSNP